MNITRKNFLRLTSATTLAAAIEAAVTACGGGGGGGSSSSNASASAGAGTGSSPPPVTPSNPSSGTGDGSTITPPTTPPASPSRSGYWSNPLTWAADGMPAGFVPTASDNIYISSAQTVYLDGDAVCGTLTIFGTLRSLDSTNADIKNINLTTGNINIMASGALQIGTEADPFPATYKATITLNGAEVGRVSRTVLGTRLGFSNSGEGRSIRVEAGGRLSLIGRAPAVRRSKLNSTGLPSFAAGSSSFTLEDAVDWKAGDEIVIGTTDFYGVSVPEKLTLAANAVSKSVSTTAGIASSRWAVKQYVTDAGMSLTPGTLTNAPANTPTELDERAFVIHLTRNIVVQGANDTAWNSNKFGAHCMFMGRTSSIKLDGVQFRRVGQAGALGRYPIHWHMMSYSMPSGMDAISDGTFIGMVVGSHYAKNCSISESGQRMITIHGTRGVTLDSNVGFDITGHGIFLEDGSEQDNVITNNVVMKIRAPTGTNQLLLHDKAASISQIGVNTTLGTTGIWYTNPKNILTNNWVNDAEGAGIWNSYSNQCFGLSVKVALSPRNTPILTWENNTATGNKGVGVQTNDEVFDDKGTTGQQGYLATFLNNPVIGVYSFKNSGGGYSNRISEGQYQTFVCADNAGMDVFGAGISDKSFMTNSLSIAESLNNTNSKRLSSYRAAFATYHELLNFKKCIAVGYTYIAGAQGDGTQTFTGGGLFRLWDLYLAPIFSFSENTEILRINCDAPFRTLPPFKDGQPMNNRNWQVAGVIYDKNGIFGIQGKYWTLNDPFFTYSATSPTNITTGVASNGVVTTDRYYGFGDFRHPDDLTQNQLPINVSRQDTGGTEVGNWNVPDGQTAIILGNMRSFCAHKGGRYKLAFPGHIPGNYFEMRIYLQKFFGDKCLLGVPFGGSFTPVVYQALLGIPRLGDGRANISTGATASVVAAGFGRYLISTASFANVVADTTGTIFWQDTTNNIIWFQCMIEPLVTAGNAVNFYGGNVFGKEYGQTIMAISA